MIRRDARSSTAIAMEYGISTVQVNNIKARRSHKHVTQDEVPRGERVLLDKITELEEEVARLREELGSRPRLDFAMEETLIKPQPSQPVHPLVGRAFLQGLATGIAWSVILMVVVRTLWP